jgi:hypothetical protein
MAANQHRYGRRSKMSLQTPITIGVVVAFVLFIVLILSKAYNPAEDRRPQKTARKPVTRTPYRSPSNRRRQRSVEDTRQPKDKNGAKKNAAQKPADVAEKPSDTPPSSEKSGEEALPADSGKPVPPVTKTEPATPVDKTETPVDKTETPAPADPPAAKATESDELLRFDSPKKTRKKKVSFFFG